MCCFMSPCSNNGNDNDECSAAGDGDDDGTTYLHNPPHFSNRGITSREKQLNMNREEGSKAGKP